MYTTLLLIVVMLGIVLIVKPQLDKGSGWLGVTVHQDPFRGMLIANDVVPSSPAHDVGILPGDIILSYKGQAVCDINTLKILIRDSYINELVRIIIERNGKRLIADTRIAKKPDNVSILPPIMPNAYAPR